MIKWLYVTLIAINLALVSFAVVYEVVMNLQHPRGCCVCGRLG